ncbi:PAS domain S-box protein [Algimonas porphyrae]|nr:PAS domain-containing sensor histidine kinase [Algimonas porphyrae]
MTSDLPTSSLDAVMNTLVDGAVVIDSRGLVRLINPAGQAIFGYTPEELIGHNISRLMPEPYHSAHDGYIRNYLETGENRIIGIGREVEGQRKSGEIFPMSLAVGEMGHRDGMLFIGIIRDLTDERQRETDFNELQARHFHLSRVAAMNEMGAAIAHEINQPLSAAANYVETGRILASRRDPPDDRLLSILDKALEQNHRAAEIISRMRTFIERGDVQSETVHLGDMIDEAMMLSLSKFRDTPIAIDRRIDPDALRVKGDAVQIQQVLVNLVRNGCEAMIDQPVKCLTLSIHPDAEHPDMSRISVSDTGEGLSDAVITDLFTAFTSTKSGGLGVGLSISRSIVHAHGGRIWATDNDGPGATFSFTLPRVQTCAEAVNVDRPA